MWDCFIRDYKHFWLITKDFGFRCEERCHRSIDQWISRNIRRLQGIEIKVEVLNAGILVERDDISQLAVKRRNLYATFGNRATQLVTDGCFWIEVHQCTPLDQKQWWRVHPLKTHSPSFRDIIAPQCGQIEKGENPMSWSQVGQFMTSGMWPSIWNRYRFTRSDDMMLKPYIICAR